MKILNYFLMLVFISVNSFAQDPRDPNNQTHLTETGKLFEVKVFPGTKETKIFVIGTKAAQINFDKLKIEATLTLGQEEKTLVIKRKKDHFVTSNLLGGDKLRLKLETKDTNKLEEMKINLKP